MLAFSLTFSFSTCVLLHWWIPWLWQSTSSLVLNLKNKTKNVAFLLSQPNTIALWNNKKRKAPKNVRSVAEASRRDSGSTTSHRFTASVVWPKDGCLRGGFFCLFVFVFLRRPGLSSSHLPRASATTLRGVTQLVACRSGRWRGVLPAHRCGLSTATNTERGALRECAWLLLGHGLRSTEALRHICMFSHCCINYGWNTDGVLLNLCSAHTSTHLTCNTQNCRHFFFFFLPETWGRGLVCFLCERRCGGVGRGERVIDPQKMGFFVWHTYCRF